MATDWVTALSLSQLHEVLNILAGDVTVCMENFTRIANEETRVDQFWARALVRTLFAWVEGHIFELKSVLRSAASHGLLTLSSGEQAVLDEVAYEVTNAGAIATRKR